ncbi:MAG: pilus assembly protein [Anaerolineae bacterium]|nr:pilus assembly protein [Anaerolineae bacterium]
MLRKYQKGQGLTEFALILPLLLLLLLGIVEGARAIWAYITVQQAAREAARYAVTGRPYIDADQSVSGQYNICNGTALDTEPDPVAIPGAYPWLCPDEGANSRVNAVKAVAIKHGRTLNVSDVCEVWKSPTDNEFYGPCSQVPGAFGVLIEGQAVSNTLTSTMVITRSDFPGTQGLNIQVTTFYNLQFITPLYDVIMGNTYLKLIGRVQLQNEGMDSAIGIEPPPGIAPPPPPPAGDAGDGYYGNAAISSVSGYKVTQSDVLRVKLDSHPDDKTYDIYLANVDYTYKICANVAVNVQGTATVDCNLASVANAPVQPGFYELFSTVVDVSTSVVAQDDNQVEVILGGSPQIVPEKNKYIWAANTPIDLSLVFHNLALGPFDVKLYDSDGNYVQTIATNVSGTSTDLVAWTVYDMEANGETKCDQSSGQKCILRSHRAGQIDTYAETKIHINQPRILLSDPGPDGSYARGELVYIYLVAHTPHERYNVRVTGQTSSDTLKFDSLDTDDYGNTPTPIAWIIPEDCSGFGAGWPNGLYDFTSHPMGEDPQIAITKNVKLYTPPVPRLSIEGGQTWPAGSVVNIRVHLHDINAVHYLEFDGLRVPTADPSNTFVTGLCGEAIVRYQIPPDTDVGTYTLASYLQADDSSPKATLPVNVLKTPIITVLGGNVALPDETITIQLTNHTPNSGYSLVLRKDEDEFVLMSVFTDENGRWTGNYDLTNLPPEFSNGIYVLESRTTIAPIVTVAQTTLTIQYADLEITKVDIPNQILMGTSIPVTLSIRNNSDVPIERWVDFDFYFLKVPEPDPVAPTYYTGYNFPGDIKSWRNTVGPLEEFQLTTVFSPTEYGLQTAYGFADTSNYVFENEQAGQVGNPNNVGSKTFLVPCFGVFTDEFDTDVSGWSTQTFGDASKANRWTSGGQLYLDSNGSSIWRSNDRDGGYMFVYRNKKLSTSSGLNVVAQLTSLELQGSYSGAGIEIRNSLNTNSAKVVLGVARDNGDSWGNDELFIRPGYRQVDGASMAYPSPGESHWRDNVEIDHPIGNPVWLRITRDPAGSGGAFKIYYRQSSGAPASITDEAWWGGAKATITASGMGDEVYVGLFNASYSSTEGQSTFGHFSMAPDPDLCTSTAPDVPFAPGYQVCKEGLQDQSFEKLPQLSEWKYTSSSGVSRVNEAARSGLQSLRGASFDSTGYNPYFSQKFTMPSWVLSTTTTFDFAFFKKIRTYMTGPDQTYQQADKFYAAVVTSLPATVGVIPAGTLVAGPIEITTGESSAGYGSLEPKWTQRVLRIPVAGGVNLEDYADQELILYVYNNSNAQSACPSTATGRCQTHFFFEDASLQTCTTQPLPASVTTRITGKLTLHFDNTGQTENPAGVKIWAYAPDDEVYESFTIAGGLFNFYNLPATESGTEYILYSQYVPGSQTEVLAGDTTVLLTTANNDSNPVQTFLDLHTLANPF